MSFKKISKAISSKLPSKEEIQTFIIKEARKHGLNPALVLSQFDHESGGLNPKAVALDKGGHPAYGLSQIRKDAFTDAKKVDKTGALQNLEFEDMGDPKNWKENAIAGMNYHKVINKYWKPKTQEEFLKSYYAGNPNGKTYKSKAAQGYPAKATEKLQQYQDIVNQHDEQQTREPSSTEGLIKEPLPKSNKFNDINKRLGMMPQEEVEALSEPSIMDKYIKQNDPEQYDKIQLAKMLKSSQDPTGLGGGMGIIKSIAPNVLAKTALATEVAPAAEVSSIIPKTTIAEKDPEAMTRWNKMMREEVDPNYLPENDPSFLRNDSPTYTQDYKATQLQKLRDQVNTPIDQDRLKLMMMGQKNIEPTPVSLEQDKFSQLKKYLGQ